MPIIDNLAIKIKLNINIFIFVVDSNISYFTYSIAFIKLVIEFVI